MNNLRLVNREIYHQVLRLIYLVVTSVGKKQLLFWMLFPVKLSLFFERRGTDLQESRRTRNYFFSAYLPVSTGTICWSVARIHDTTTHATAVSQRVWMTSHQTCPGLQFTFSPNENWDWHAPRTPGLCRFWTFIRQRKRKSCILANKSNPLVKLELNQHTDTKTSQT